MFAVHNLRMFFQLTCIIDSSPKIIKKHNVYILSTNEDIMFQSDLLIFSVLRPKQGLEPPSGKHINLKKIPFYIMIYHFCKRVGGTCIPK
jgi:hypothetical protein